MAIVYRSLARNRKQFIASDKLTGKQKCDPFNNFRIGIYISWRLTALLQGSSNVAEVLYSKPSRV